MALTGYLADYSLAEILQFIQQGSKTGLLSISIEPNPAENIAGIYEYTWFQSGRVVAHAKDLSSFGLISMLEKRNWVGAETSASLRAQSKTLTSPLGLHLKSINLVDVEQLRILFHAQVLQAVCALFKLSNAKFHFDDRASVSQIKPEMTGMSVTAVEVSLLGMRSLKDWTYLERKLPAPEFGLQRLQEALPEYKLDTQETQMFIAADGKCSIDELATEIGISVRKAQEIAFRLTAVSLLKEIALDSPSLEQSLRKAPAANSISASNAISASSAINASSAKPKVSNSFLNNLVGFLKKQK
jgi:Domain of unknown function (DUF4388)